MEDELRAAVLDDSILLAEIRHRRPRFSSLADSMTRSVPLANRGRAGVVAAVRAGAAVRAEDCDATGPFRARSERNEKARASGRAGKTHPV